MKYLIQSCTAELENQEIVTLDFYLVSDPDPYRPYGINSVLRNSSGEKIDERTALRCYATKDEVEKVVQMLCDQLVMPCTLCDILL